MSTRSLGVGAGLAALDGDAAVRIRAGNVCGEVQIEEFASQGGAVQCVARGAGADSKDLVGPRPCFLARGQYHNTCPPLPRPSRSPPLEIIYTNKKGPKKRRWGEVEPESQSPVLLEVHHDPCELAAS